MKQSASISGDDIYCVRRRVGGDYSSSNPAASWASCSADDHLLITVAIATHNAESDTEAFVLDPGMGHTQWTDHTHRPQGINNSES